MLMRSGQVRILPAESLRFPEEGSSPRVADLGRGRKA